MPQQQPSKAPATQTTAPNPSSYLAMGCIMAAGALWGCIGLFNRSLSAMGISSSSIVLLRNTGACVLLGLLFLLKDRSIFQIRVRHLPFFFGTGVVSLLFFTLCYFRSQQLSSLSVAGILLYTSPTFVVVLSALVFKDPFTKRKLCALLIAFLGCTFVTGIWGGELSLSLQGLLLGLGSGFFYATYSIFGRIALAHYPPFTVTFYTFLFAGVGALFFLDREDMATASSSLWSVFLVLGLIIISTILPYLLYTKGLNDLGDSGKAAILASVEPVVASIVGILAFGEPMGLGVILGLVCILISVYILR
ncbi:MAG: EamA family transporter [Evtepia sp.]|uniref:DMT family transporter n=1 Tax=Evtepia sp. TaxID=2773933 RepID=UPI002A75A92C|nr:EamA family transporter [Evtepia sp.]MDY3015371.1 EamA family transporter [Evtepia sp.]